MAEKETIFEAQIDVNKAIQDTQRLKQEIEMLKSQTKSAKDQQGELSEEYIGYSAALKNTQTELRQNEQMTSKVIEAQTANTGSIKSMRAELSVVSKQWAELSAEERNNSEIGKKLAARKLELTDALKKEEKATGDTRRNVGNYQEGMEGALGSVSQFIPAAGNAGGAAKKLGLAFKLMLGPIGLIIAAIALVVGAIKSFFTSNEEGQDKLLKFQAIFSTVMGNISDIMGNIGKVLVSAFEAPGEAMDKLIEAGNKLLNFFRDTFGNIIGGIIEKFGARVMTDFAKMGLAWQKFKNLFVDNSEKIAIAQEKVNAGNAKIEAANERIKTGAKNLGDAIVDGYNKARKGLKDFIDEQNREIAIAQMLADMQSNLNKKTRAYMVQNAKDQRDIAKLKNTALDKENFSIDERIIALQKAGELENVILERNLDIARTKLKIKETSNALSNSTREDLEEEAKLRAELYDAETAAYQKQKAIVSQISALHIQQEAERKKAAQDAINSLQKELDIYNVVNKTKLAGAEKLTEDLLRVEGSRLAQIREQQDTINEQSFEKGLIDEQTHRLNKLKIADEYNTSLRDLNLQYEEQEKAERAEREQLDFENSLEVMNEHAFQRLDAQKIALEAQREQELQYAEMIGADTSLIKEKYAAIELEIERAKTDAKFELAAGFAGNIATIFGEQTKIGKAAAIAETTINTYKAATGAYSALAPIPGVGPALGIAAAAAAVAAGIANVKKIIAVKTDVKSGGGSSPSAAQSASPGTNTTSQSAINPQIGQGIIGAQVAGSPASVSNNVNNQPRTVLVIDDVTQKQGTEKLSTRVSTV